MIALPTLPLALPDPAWHTMDTRGNSAAYKELREWMKGQSDAQLFARKRQQEAFISYNYGSTICVWRAGECVRIRPLKGGIPERNRPHEELLAVRECVREIARDIDRELLWRFEQRLQKEAEAKEARRWRQKAARRNKVRIAA